MSGGGLSKRLFGYSRRERSGTFILAAILVMVIIHRAVTFSARHNKSASGPMASDTVQAVDLTTGGNIGGDTIDPGVQMSHFDPNTATREQLLVLGLSQKQANTIINYRNSGAVFREPSDFLKVYGIAAPLQEKLIPWIEIGEEYRPAVVAQRAVKANPSGELSYREKATPEVITPGIAERIDINSADSSQLIRLKGIGAVLSVRMIRYRDLLGGYSSYSQLSEVYGIDSLLAATISSDIFIDTTLIRRVDLNTAEYSELLRHPYIGREKASLIIKYRSLAGPFISSFELVQNRILSSEEYSLLRPYLAITTDNQ